MFKTLEDPWTGSESDKFVLLGYLDQLRKDPAFLSSEAVLPDLTDELAPVSIGDQKNGSLGGAGQHKGRGRDRAGLTGLVCWEVWVPSGLSPVHCPFPPPGVSPPVALLCV